MGEVFRGVRAVFFDVDNTLYDFEESMEHAFVHLCGAYAGVLEGVQPKQLSEAYWSAYHGVAEAEKHALIEKDPDLYRRTIWAAALARLEIEAEDARRRLARFDPALPSTLGEADGFARVLTQEFARLRPDHWRAAMYPGARELLDELRGRFVLGAITNGPSVIQRPKLEAFRYRDYFPENLVFVSGEFGVRKPDPSIFLAAAKAAGVAPEACAMVGDAREFDMPAKAVGFRTILFDGKCAGPDCAADPHPPDAIVRSYAEVRRLLGL